MIKQYCVHYYFLNKSDTVKRAKILAIQFRRKPIPVEQEQAGIVREAGIYTDVEFLSALDDSLDWNFPETIMEPYSGLILGGSGDFDFHGGRDEDDPDRQISYEFLGKLRPLFQYVFDNDIPTLGICYGHQLLGAFAGAQVRYDEQQKKTSSHDVKLMVDKNEFFLFSDLPDSFAANYAHKDALDRVPEGAVLLMNGGDKCKVSALRYKNNIYTTQFHPELNYQDMVDRMKHAPGYLPEGIIADEIFKDDPNACKVLRNFSKWVAQLTEQKTADSPATRSSVG